MAVDACWLNTNIQTLVDLLEEENTGTANTLQAIQLVGVCTSRKVLVSKWLYRTYTHIPKKSSLYSEEPIGFAISFTVAFENSSNSTAPLTKVDWNHQLNWKITKNEWKWNTIMWPRKFFLPSTVLLLTLEYHLLNSLA